jgi:cyanate lyase
MMSKKDMTRAIVEAKEAMGATWEGVAEAAGLAPVYVTSACLGMNHLNKQAADGLCSFLKLDAGVSKALQAFPTKVWDQTVPTDPLVYRFYEIVGVYGDTLKEVIQEKFGDGIMSAIDFSMHIDKIEDPKGDRVKVTMNGKFLPYRSW